MYYSATAYSDYGQNLYGTSEPQDIPFSAERAGYAVPDPAVGCCVGAPQATRFTLVDPFWIQIRPSFGNGFLSFPHAKQPHDATPGIFTAVLLNQEGMPVLTLGGVDFQAGTTTWAPQDAVEATYISGNRLNIRAMLTALGVGAPELLNQPLWLSLEGYDGTTAVVAWEAA